MLGIAKVALIVMILLTALAASMTLPSLLSSEVPPAKNTEVLPPQHTQEPPSGNDQLPPTKNDGDRMIIVWQRSGGIAGFQDRLVINTNGSAYFTSNRLGNATMVLNESDMKEILFDIDLITNYGVYKPKSGAADFFSYRLEIYSNQNSTITKAAEWVDAWASEEVLPKDLQQIQSVLMSVSEKLRQSASITQNTQDKAVDIAKEFILNAPTFKFDGISKTFKVVKVNILESYPLQYLVTMTFDCAHSGFGDRTGKILLQVITSHTAVVKVVSGNVTSAVIDDFWDELLQMLVH